MLETLVHGIRPGQLLSYMTDLREIHIGITCELTTSCLWSDSDSVTTALR
jgi:hypothetical protein